MDCILCYRMATKRQIKYWQGNPDSKVHGAYMGPIRDRQVPGGPHVGPMNFVIRDMMYR